MLRPLDDLDAGDQRLRRNAERRVERAQEAVDAHADGQPAARRLEMNVAGVQLHRLVDQFVDRAHHGRAAREVAQIVETVFARRFGGVGRRRGFPLLAERGGDVLEGGDDDGDRLAEHQLGRLARLAVHRVAHRQSRPAVGGRERIDRDVAQKARREAIGERWSAHELGQRRPPQSEKLGRGGGEIVPGNARGGPQPAQAVTGVSAGVSRDDVEGVLRRLFWRKKYSARTRSRNCRRRNRYVV